MTGLRRRGQRICQSLRNDPRLRVIGNQNRRILQSIIVIGIRRHCHPVQVSVPRSVKAQHRRVRGLIRAVIGRDMLRAYRVFQNTHSFVLHSFMSMASPPRRRLSSAASAIRWLSTDASALVLLPPPRCSVCRKSRIMAASLPLCPPAGV